MADPNPAPVPQNALSAINQLEVQGQVVPGFVLVQPQLPINHHEGHAYGQVAPGLIQVQTEPPINQPPCYGITN